MKKTKLSFRALRTVVAAAVAVLVLALTGCDNGGGSGPSMVTVTFDANSATGTVPAPQTVTRGTSITLPGRGGLVNGDLFFGGWSTNAAGTGSRHIAGSSFNVTGNVTLFAVWAVPAEITITVTGIPSVYSDGVIFLTHPGTMHEVAWSGWQTITGGSATFSLITIPGTYDVYFDSGDSLFSVSSRNLVAGPQTIPFANFIFVEPISITVTEIPNRYIGQWNEGYIELLLPGTFNDVDWDWTDITSSSATFSFSWALPGTYDIRLWLEFDDDDDWGEQLYTLSSRSLTAGNNIIPLSAFTQVQPLTITVTGIPIQYIGGCNDGNMELLLPGTSRDVAWGWTYIDSSLATFSLFASPGTYDIRMWLFDSGNGEEQLYTISSRNLSASNTIPFSAFTRVDPITITVTGIPDRYTFGEIHLWSAGGNAGGWASVRGDASAVFSVFVTPGTYNISLWLSGSGAGGWVSGSYSLSSRTITAGPNTIPFSAFTIGHSGFSETLERSERALPDRSRARARSVRAAS